MANYLMKYKGIYRIMPELDKETNDFIRDENDNIEDADIYISCQYGNRITTYGHLDGKKAVWLSAYIPSIGRGHNIIKALKEKNIEYQKYEESDEEIQFIFMAKDIEYVAKLMRAKTSGANISPFSTKNLPKAKNVELPINELKRYKDIISIVDRKNLLVIHRTTTSFLENIFQKKMRKTNKLFDYKSDMKKMMMTRFRKEYIYTKDKDLWEEYLTYLKDELNEICKEQYS